MTILLNMPQGWQPNAKHLSNQMLEGTSAIQRAITRLKQLGYLVCRSIRDAAGRFLRSDWEINEIPAPPSDENIDARGNVIAVDRPDQAPKNLRREARQRAKSGQKTEVKRQTETLAAASFNPYPGFPDTGFENVINIDISNIQSIEREAGFENLEVETECQIQETESEYQCQENNLFAKTASTRSDQYSAPAESAKYWNETELREFQSQLEDLGKRLGRKSPVAWAFTIVQNLRTGTPCTYWEEFKAGVPLGTSEQREWETAPGVPCAIAIQCLEADFLSRPGTTPQEAARKAAQVVSRPKEMAAVWETIKARVVFQKEEWERQSALGVQTPVVDSWLRAKPSVSVEEAAIALHEIQSALPPALQPSDEPSSLPPLAVPVLSESVDGGATNVASEVDEVAIAAKTTIWATLSKFARPNKKRNILEANIAEVKKLVPVVTAAKEVKCDAVADEEEEIW